MIELGVNSMEISKERLLEMFALRKMWLLLLQMTVRSPLYWLGVRTYTVLYA